MKNRISAVFMFLKITEYICRIGLRRACENLGYEKSACDIILLAAVRGVGRAEVGEIRQVPACTRVAMCRLYP